MNLNASFKAVNLLLDKGVKVQRVDKNIAELRPGDFIISGDKTNILKDVATATGVDFTSFQGNSGAKTHQVKRMRTGMYQRYWGGNMDEGWTRFLLEQFAFPYKSLMDADKPLAAGRAFVSMGTAKRWSAPPTFNGRRIGEAGLSEIPITRTPWALAAATASTTSRR